MAFLTIGGITLEVTADEATEPTPIAVGERERAASGRDGGWVRAEIAVYRFRADDLTQAQWAALVAVAPLGVAVACSGDALTASGGSGGAGDYLVTRSADVTWDATAQAAVYTAHLDLEAAA